MFSGTPFDFNIIPLEERIVLDATAVTTVDDSYTFNTGGGHILDITANDSGFDSATMNIKIQNGPTSGTLTLLADDTIFYQHDGNPGTLTDSFTYYIVNDPENGANSPFLTTVNLTRAPDPDPGDILPDAVDDNYLPTDIIDPLANDIQGNAADPESDGFIEIINIDTVGLFGELIPQGDGTYRYAFDFNGIHYTNLAVGASLNEEFSYEVQDGDGDTDVALITITITKDIPNIDVTGFSDGSDPASFSMIYERDTLDPTPALIFPAETDLATNEQVRYVVLSADTTLGLPNFFRDGDRLIVSQNPETVQTVLVGTSLESTSQSTLNALASDLGFIADGGSTNIYFEIAQGATATDVLNFIKGLQFSTTSVISIPRVFDLTVIDTVNSETDSVKASINITELNAPPVANPDGVYVANRNTTLHVSAANGVLANDTDPNTTFTLNAVLLTGPANGQVVLNADGSFEYTPNPGFVGIDSFTYLANDGLLDSEVATVILQSIDPTPLALNDSVVPAEVFDPLANDTLGDGVTEIINLETVSESGTLVDLGNGTYAFELNFESYKYQNLDVGDFYTEVFSYTIQDGVGDTSTGTIAVQVTKNAPNIDVNGFGVFGDPTSVQHEYVLVPSNPVSLNLFPQVTDLQSFDSIGYIRISGVFENGDLFAAQNLVSIIDFAYLGNPTLPGAVALDPELLLADLAQVGTDHLFLRVRDSATVADVLSLLKNFQFETTSTSLVVRQFNFLLIDDFGAEADGATVFIEPLAPGAFDDGPYVSPADTVLNVNALNGLLANDSNPLGEVITIALTSGPENGQLTVNADGSFVYTPDAGFNGRDQFTYVLNGTNEATVFLEIGNIPLLAEEVPLTGDTLSADFGATTGLNVVANDSGFDPEVMRVEIVSDPVSGTIIVDNDGTVFYTHGGGNSSSDSFTYRIIDFPSGTVSDPVTVNLNIEQLQLPFFKVILPEPQVETIASDITIHVVPSEEFIYNEDLISAVEATLRNTFFTNSSAPEFSFSIGGLASIDVLLVNGSNLIDLDVVVATSVGNVTFTLAGEIIFNDATNEGSVDVTLTMDAGIADLPADEFALILSQYQVSLQNVDQVDNVETIVELQNELGVSALEGWPSLPDLHIGLANPLASTIGTDYVVDVIVHPESIESFTDITTLEHSLSAKLTTTGGQPRFGVTFDATTIPLANLALGENLISESFVVATSAGNVTFNLTGVITVPSLIGEEVAIELNLLLDAGGVQIPPAELNALLDSYLLTFQDMDSLTVVTLFMKTANSGGEIELAGNRELTPQTITFGEPTVSFDNLLMEIDFIPQSTTFPTADNFITQFEYNVSADYTAVASPPAVSLKVSGEETEFVNLNNDGVVIQQTFLRDTSIGTVEFEFTGVFNGPSRNFTASLTMDTGGYGLPAEELNGIIDSLKVSIYYGTGVSNFDYSIKATDAEGTVTHVAVPEPIPAEIVTSIPNVAPSASNVIVNPITEADTIVGNLDIARFSHTLAANILWNGVNAQMHFSIGGLSTDVELISLNGYQRIATIDVMTSVGEITFVIASSVNLPLSAGSGTAFFELTVDTNGLEIPASELNQILTGYTIVMEQITAFTQESTSVSALTEFGDVVTASDPVIDLIPEAINDEALPDQAFNPLANDVPGDGNLTITQIETQGLYGTLELQNDGTYLYTVDPDSFESIQVLPNQNFQDTFNYTIEDASGDISTATITVTIINYVPDIDVTGFSDASDPATVDHEFDVNNPQPVTLFPAATNLESEDPLIYIRLWVDSGFLQFEAGDKILFGSLDAVEN
ncbi:MAG: tandem-95 repeat protein, partial [Chlamydiia bacterium]|nr:tandem-95 repeat protein [Chlamydiia bacterium]